MSPLKDPFPCLVVRPNQLCFAWRTHRASAEREEIRPAIELLTAALFRRGIGILSHEVTRLLGRHQRHRVRYSEVRELHFAKAGDEDVGWVDVAVNQLEGFPVWTNPLMQVIETRAQLRS